MSAKRLNGETLRPVAETNEDHMEAELDDEVEKELREFEELLDTPGVEGKPGTGSLGKENEGGSDMELEDMDQDAEKKTQAVSKLKEKTTIVGEAVPSSTLFVEEEPLGDHWIEKLGNSDDEKETSHGEDKLRLIRDLCDPDPGQTHINRDKPSLGNSTLDPSLAKQVEELAAQAQAMARSPEPYSDDSSNDPDFPSPGKRKSRSRARSKRPSKASRSHPRDSPKKKQKTEKAVKHDSQGPAQRLQGKTADHLKSRYSLENGDLILDHDGEMAHQKPSQNRIDSQSIRQTQHHVKALEFDETNSGKIQQRVGSQTDEYQPKVVLQQLPPATSPAEQDLRNSQFPDPSSNPLKLPVNGICPPSPHHPGNPTRLGDNEADQDKQLEAEELEEPSQAVVPTNPFQEPKYCAIEHIIHLRFKNNFALDSERLEMLGADRPQILSPEIHAYTKYFESHPWLVACNELKRLFCWPCLFFSSKMNWSLSCSEHTEPTVGKDLTMHAQTPAHHESIKQMNEFQKRNKSSIISALKTNNFLDGTWSEKDQEAVILKGRPQPVLDGMGDEGNDKGEVRKLYDVAKWICGCSNTKELYCWPCLLHNRVWQFSGNVSFLKIAGLKHETDQKHMEACFALGKRVYELQEKSAENVDDCKGKARSFVMNFVGLFCAEKMKINNGDMTATDFLDSIDLMSEYNSRLRTFIDGKSSSAKMAAAQALVPAVQDSVEFCLKDRISEELRKSNFISLIFDHSSGVSNKAILSVIARYVDGSGHVHETFVKLLTVGYNTPSSLLVDEFFQVIWELQCQASLVGFTYDGYLVKPGNIPEFNSNVQKLCPNAKFFHYTEHTFKRVLKQTLCHVPICRAALQKVKELATFFEQNPAARKGLTDITSAAENSDCVGLWRSPNFITTVFLYHAVIIDILESICRTPTLWKVQTVIQAASFIDFFKDPANRFFITLMARIFDIVEELSTELRRDIPIEELKPITTHTALKLQKLGRNFDSVVDSACSSVAEIKQESLREAMATLREQFTSVIRMVVKLVKNRVFGLEAGYFKMSKSPPKTDVTNFIKLEEQYLILQSATLPSNFNAERLSNELQFFHSTTTANSSFSDVIALMNNYNIVDVLPEFFKFLQLALTIPKSQIDSTIPAVRRVAAYIEGKKDVNSVDALFWMEKAFLTNLGDDPNFCIRVADRVLSLTEGGILEKHFQA